MTWQQVVATLIALLTFAGLAVGRVPRFHINRAGIAAIGAGLLLASGAISFHEAEKTVDLRTIVLLFSMMVINAVLELAGFFTWVGNLVIERAQTPLALLSAVVLAGGVLSALFINDPVVLMLTPLVCGVTLRLGLKPIPYLVALATASNIGSAATITGNPQNIVIGSASGISYLQFLASLGPISLLGMGIVVGVIWLVYRRDLAARSEPVAPAPRSANAQSMAEASELVYVPILRKCLLVIAALVIAFLAGVEVPLAAYLAACTLLFTRRIKSQKILNLIDWPLLVLFFGLFVVTGALEITGVSQLLFAQVRALAQSGVAPLAAVTLLLSNTISNVPAVLLFKPLVPQFANPQQTWLTLAATSTLAGNLTLIGSVANLIVAEQALKFGIRLTFGEYLRAGVLITLLSLAVAVLWLATLRPA